MHERTGLLQIAAGLVITRSIRPPKTQGHHYVATRPVRNATLIGNGPEAMKYVSMVGHDLKLDEGIGVCGKEGQSVPVGVGIPTVRIDRMTVGGTA